LPPCPKQGIDNDFCLYKQGSKGTQVIGRHKRVKRYPAAAKGCELVGAGRWALSGIKITNGCFNTVLEVPGSDHAVPTIISAAAENKDRGRV
jgi:hypothetical protein